MILHRTGPWTCTQLICGKKLTSVKLLPEKILNGETAWFQDTGTVMILHRTGPKRTLTGTHSQRSSDATMFSSNVLRVLRRRDVQQQRCTDGLRLPMGRMMAALTTPSMTCPRTNTRELRS